MVDHAKKFSKNLEFRKKLSLNTGDHNEVDYQTILNPEMIGLRLPKQDLDHLKDFNRVTTLAQQEKEFETQDSMMNKLEAFLHYLVMVKMDTVWKPNMYVRDMTRRIDSCERFSSSPWLQ